MRRLVYSTKKINATDDVNGPLPDLYVVKIWYEVDPGHDVAAPEAAEEIITVFANSPQQAMDYAKMEWSGPIDRIEIVDINPEDYDYSDDTIFNSTKITASSSSREDAKRNKMYRPSLYPDVDPERIEDLLAIDWTDVTSHDCKDFLIDTELFPDLSKIASVSYADDDTLANIAEIGYDGAYSVTYTDGTTSTFAWADGTDGLDEIQSCTSITGSEEISFREWLDSAYYPGFDTSGLSDDEFFELEDQYREEVPRDQREFNYR